MGTASTIGGTYLKGSYLKKAEDGNLWECFLLEGLTRMMYHFIQDSDFVLTADLYEKRYRELQHTLSYTE